MSLAQVVQVVLQQNPEIAAARWDAAAAGSRLDAARSQRWPTLSLEASHTYSLDDQRLIASQYNGDPGIFASQVSKADLVTKLPLYSGGEITSGIGVAEAEHASADASADWLSQKTVFIVASVFTAMLEQREEIASLNFSVEVLAEHLEQVESLVRAQKAAAIDLLKTKVRLADLQQQLFRAQNVFAAKKRQLATLLGRQDSSGLSISGNLAAEPFSVPGAADLYAAALEQRYDYRAASSALDAQAHRVRAAASGDLPKASAIASYGMRLGDLEESEDAGFAGVTISLPLFEGGRTRTRVNLEQARLHAAEKRLYTLELVIRSEIESALLDIHSSQSRISVTRLAVEQARESLRIERMKYELGSGLLTDVLDAQAALLRSETNHTQALADFFVAKLQLKLASGEKLL